MSFINGNSTRRPDRANQVYQGNNASSGISYTSKQLSTLYNPFSIKNNSPKWPDGLATHSIGRKQNFASEMYGQDFIICLFPGATNWCVAYGAGKQDDGTLTPAIVANHGDDRTFTIGQYSADVGTTPAVRNWSLLFQKDTYSAWRPVSYALKVRCCNNDEKNDGWFEAIRTSRDTFLEGFGIVVQDGIVDEKTISRKVEPQQAQSVFNPRIYRGSALPNTDLAKSWMENLEWYKMPSYVTGELKDIGDYVFQLNSESEFNEFVKIRPINGADDVCTQSDLWFYGWDPVNPRLNTSIPDVRNDVNATNTFHIQTPAKEVAANIPADKIMSLQDSIIADSMDMIIIKIHGINNLSRILLHSVANIEIMCGEFSNLAQYQTVCYSDRNAINAYVNDRLMNHKLPYDTDSQYS